MNENTLIYSTTAYFVILGIWWCRSYFIKFLEKFLNLWN